MTKEIGKIKSISLGFGGYQDAMFGVIVELGTDGSGWGCMDFKGTWDSRSAKGKNEAWILERDQIYAKTQLFIERIMLVFFASSMIDLVGIPVEAVFDSPNGRLASWRVLTEAL